MIVRQRRPIHEVFNDGYLYYGYDTVLRDQYKKRIGDTFEEKGKLAYQELTARDKDYYLAGMTNATLDLKLKTMYPQSFRRIAKSKLKVFIDNEKYDVIKVDGDKNKRYLYFYLQKVGVSDE